MKHYDIIVIGSGGGSKITRPAANRGKRVAIIEESHLGGTCLNHGCIPSKMLIHPADMASVIEDAKRFEFDRPQALKVRFAELVERVNRTIDEESASVAPLYDEHPNVTYYRGRGRFVEDKVVEVNGEAITADQIVIAVGCQPQIPSHLEGLQNVPYMTYKEILRNTKQPKKAIVIGGGFIACELGYFLGAFGSDVEFIIRSELLRHLDGEVKAAFNRIFSERFKVRYGAVPKRVSHDGENFRLISSLPDGSELVTEGDALLVCTGVSPNTYDFGLENTRIQVNESGYIQVDDHLQTAVPGVYAMGDVIGRYHFRHTANFEGEYLFDLLMKPESDRRPIHYPPIPYAVFSHPQVGAVGATEEELQGTDYIVGVNSYAASAMGMALQAEEGFCKLLFDRKSRKLLGAHIIGDEASNMVHMLIAYMQMGASLDDMLETIFIHPALPEVVRNAARKAKKSL